MIGCQINSLDGDPSQQAASFAHNSGTTTSPISPVFGGAICDHQQLQFQPAQLLRSKSLNDISNDSQIPAFASDRFINLHPNQNNSNNNNNSDQATNLSMNNNSMIDHNDYHFGGINTQHLSLNYNNHPQQSHQNNLQHTIATQCMPMPPPFNIYANSQQQIMRNLNDNQCSISMNDSKPLDSAAANPSSMFDLCNPMAVNLNGVTEQIGNLHL